MNFLYAKVHGTLCYCINIVLILCPAIFSYIHTSKEVLIPVFCGGIAFVYTLFTNAEFGLVKVIKFSNALLLDLLLGSFLIVSPKLFHYEGYVYQLPYLWIGLIKIFTALAAGNSLHSSHLEKRNHRASAFHQFISQLKNQTNGFHHSVSKWMNSIEKKSVV